jgi:hypothetical protein
MHQRASASRPARSTPSLTSAPSGPDVGCPGPPAGPAGKAWRINKTPQGGVAAGVSTSRWTRVSRRRISPWSPLRGYIHGTGVRRRVHNPPTLGAPGARHPDDRTTDQAGGVWRGWPRPTTACTWSARVDWSSDRHRPRGTGPVKHGAVDSDARCASEQDGPQVKPGRGTKPARRPRPQGERGGARRASRAAQVPTFGPDQWFQLRLPASRPRRVRP